jgi:hypothetical protein
MSRALADLLGTNEPEFFLRLRVRERGVGLPSADIRLSTQVCQTARRKVAELGLDPQDTTGVELYRALQQRLCHDELLLRSSLAVEAQATPTEVLTQLATKLAQLEQPSPLYGVKTSVLKQIIKKLKPKATMKRLGYRSLDSMLKHEPVAQLLAACQLVELPAWHEAKLKAYEALQGKDFEAKKAQFIVPTTKKWPDIGEQHSHAHKNNIVVVPEIGAVVVLPLTHDLPGLAVATSVLALSAHNDLRALSAYFRLQQVYPDMGARVAAALRQTPEVQVASGETPLPWRVVHWLSGHASHASLAAMFEPHVQPEDLQWQNMGAALAALHPDLVFWRDTDAVGLLDNHEAVSLNVLDVALGLCNGLDYARRVLHHMRDALDRELHACYTSPQQVTEAFAADSMEMTTE